MFAQSAIEGSPIGRLHPLVKVILLVSTAVFACFVSNHGLLAAFLALVILGSRLSGLSFGRSGSLIKLYLLSAPMLLVVFVLSYLPGASSLAQGVLLGLQQGSLYVLRFLILILVNTLVVSYSDPREILQVLRALHFPEVAGCLIVHVINFLPRLSREMQTIVEAQSLRGLRWRRLWRPSSWLPLAVPMLLSTMRYSEQSAISLELRRGLGNVSRPLPRLAGRDWCALALCLALAAFSLARYDSAAEIQSNLTVKTTSTQMSTGSAAP